MLRVTKLLIADKIAAFIDTASCMQLVQHKLALIRQEMRYKVRRTLKPEMYVSLELHYGGKQNGLVQRLGEECLVLNKSTIIPYINIRSFKILAFDGKAWQ